MQTIDISKLFSNIQIVRPHYSTSQEHKICILRTYEVQEKTHPQSQDETSHKSWFYTNARYWVRRSKNDKGDELPVYQRTACLLTIRAYGK